MARQLRTQLVVGLTDKASAPANRIATALARMKAVSQMNIGQRMGVAANTMKRSSVAATGLSMGLGLVARQGFLAAYNLEKVMNKLEAVGKLNKAQRKEFQNLALGLNAKFPFTSTEIAEAGVELMKAGLTFEQAKGALEETLRLSMAGDIDRGQAADIATNVMTGMRLPMETAEQVRASLKRVTDNLAYAATESNTDVRMMGETFKYIAPLAAAAGISIEKVSAMSMVMAKNAIKASEAGVAMRAGIVKMVKPTVFAQKAFKRLGVNVGDYVKQGRAVKSDDIINGLSADGVNVSGMKKIFDNILSDSALQNQPAQLAARLTDEIAKSLGSDSVVDKNAIAASLNEIVTASANEVDFLGIMRVLREKGATPGDLANIFGSKQLARLMTLLTADIDALTKEVAEKSKGSAEVMADKMMQGIVKSSAKLKAAWENLWIKIGQTGVLDQISNAFDSIAQSLDRISKTSPGLLKFGVYALGALAVLGPLGFMMTGVSASVSMLTAGLSMAGLGVAGLGRVLAGPFIASAVGARKQLLWLNAAAMVQGGGRFKLLAGSLLSLLNPFKLVKRLAGGAGTALRVMGRGAMLLMGISWPVVLGVAAIAGVIAYWDKLKAFFSGFFGEIDAAFKEAGLGEPVKAVLNIFSDLGDAVGKVIDYVKELLGFNTDENGLVSWSDAGKNAARKLASVIKMVIEKIKSAYGWMKSLFGLGGATPSKDSGPPKIEARARGGSVRAGQPYLVGEKGPELRMFSRNGHIMPNNQLMNNLSSGGRSGGRSMSVGNVSVTVNANSPVNNARQLGQEVGKAVRNEIANSYSDGGFA